MQEVEKLIKQGVKTLKEAAKKCKSINGDKLYREIEELDNDDIYYAPDAPDMFEAAIDYCIEQLTDALDESR